MITPVMVLDVTEAHIKQVPAGILLGLYTTGSPDIRASAMDFARHPDSIRICQDHGSDKTADILDMESGAATPQDCVSWIPEARASFNNGSRKGQRWPGIYASLSRITEVANAFTAARITNVPLWVAEWGLDKASALHNIIAENGPFPTIAFQIKNQGIDDLNFFSDQWLNRRSGMGTPTVKAQIPPGPWNDAHAWDWEDVYVLGVGLDGHLHTFHFDRKTGEWIKLA